MVPSQVEAGGFASAPLLKQSLDDAALYHLRIRQAKVLWARGFGRELGLGKFRNYLDTIPQIPIFPADYAERFPQLILVDTRPSIVLQCQFLGIQFNGDNETFVDYDPSKRPTQPVYWMCCQDGKKNLKKRVRDCRAKFQSDEVGGTDKEGLAFFAQNRQILQNHYLDLPGSVRRGSRGYAACLCLHGGKPCLYCFWDDCEDSEGGSVSRGSVVG